MNIEQHIAIPFTISPTNHFLIDGQLNDIFTRYILDSGAGKCCLSLSKATELDLVVAESGHTASGVGEGYMNRFEVVVPKLSIGDWTTTDFAAAGLDLSAMNQALVGIGATAVDGIIGADILLENDVVMDYQQMHLRIEGNKIGFECIRSNHAVVEVELNNNNEKSLFIVDTGAGQTCIDIEKAERWGLTLKELEDKATGIGSTSMPISSAMIPKVRFGNFDIFEYNMTIIDLAHVNEAFAEIGTKEVDAIIGADVLLKYEAIIDCKDKMLYLRTL
ncbi:MAG: aspartyl protease family protein [Chitinophagales bacterium]